MRQGVCPQNSSFTRVFPKSECMSSRILSCFLSLVIVIGSNFWFSSTALARSYLYPEARYVSPEGEALSGITVPLTDEAGNNLMNNPAGLAKVSGYRAEPLNMSFQMNSNSVSNLTASQLHSFSLGGLTSTMNLAANNNVPFGVGFSNMSAFSWNGFGIGILAQEFSRAQSDGTNVKTQVVSQMIPTAGYAFGLARNIIRIGYSLQYVNQTEGTATQTSNSSATFLSGLQKGSGLSHNVSINFAFPFSYRPTFSFMVRNIGGVTYSSTSLWPRGTGVTGAPANEPMTIDMAFDFMVRITGTVKSHFFFQYEDFSSQSSIPNIFDRLKTGFDLSLSPSFVFRAGMTGLMQLSAGGVAQFSFGAALKGESSEIGIAYYNEPNPLGALWDTRYALQYKIMLGEKPKKAKEMSTVGNKR